MPARLLHYERHSGIDQEAEDIRHIAVPTERDHKFRPRRLDHLTIVGERRAAEPFGALYGNSLGAVGNADDVAFELPQYPQIRRVVGGVPMAHFNSGDALWDAHEILLR